MKAKASKFLPLLLNEVITLKKYALIACALATFMYTNIGAAQTITLAQDTKLIPVGWSVAEDVKFQKNTTAELSPDGQVISGTLNSDTYLRPTGWRSMINDFYYSAAAPAFFPPFYYDSFDDFGPDPIPAMLVPTYGHARYKGNTVVTFASDGTVLSGTIDDDVTLNLQKGKYGFVNFKGDSVLTFYPTGSVQTGTLADDTALRPLGYQNNTGNGIAGFVDFKGGTAISFDQNGFVTSGTLKETTTWYNADGSSATLPPKIIVNFTPTGIEVAD